MDILDYLDKNIGKLIYESEVLEGNQLSRDEVQWIVDHLDQIDEWLQTSRDDVYDLMKEAMTKAPE